MFKKIKIEKISVFSKIEKRLKIFTSSRTIGKIKIQKIKIGKIKAFSGHNEKIFFPVVR